MTAFAAGCLVLAAVTVAWPAPGARQRRRRLVPSGPAHARPRQWAVWRDRWSARPGVGAAPLVVGVVAGVVVAVLVAGVVAGVITASYGTLAVRTLRARTARQAHARHRAALLDALSGAAADLRAGLPAERAVTGLTAAAPGRAQAESPDPLLTRVRAATQLAGRTGAPLADLLERIEADARAGDRARAALAGQAAGSRATAYLLAALPVAGIGLGYAIGADPVTVLLTTPIGGACALGAVALQLAGLLWARRILRPEVLRPEAVTGP